MQRYRTKRFQNRIAESRFSLSATISLCLLVWLVAGLGVTPNGWDWSTLIEQPMLILRSPLLITLPCLVVSTLLMAELNNTNALIRIYSRMVSCTFLVLSTMCVFHFLSVRAAVTVLCAIFFYTSLFHTYQDSRAAGWTFYAFLSLGVASVAFVQVLFFLPLLWILMTTKLLSMSSRTFFASLLGLVTPYWFLAGIALLMHRTGDLASHFVEIAQFSMPLDVSGLSLGQLITGVFVIICAALGITHYLLTRQHDRIRTQLLYEVFIFVDVFSIVMLLLQPQHCESLLGIIIVNTSPLVAHFVALTQTKWTDLTTKLLLLSAILITIYNLWEPSLTF